MEESTRVELPRERLKKTSAEQTILRNLQELELELSEERNPGRKKQLTSQIDELKNYLASVQGPSYSDLEKENEQLEKQLEETKKKLDRALKECNLLKDNQFTLAPDFVPIHEKDNKFKLYTVLLKKYAPLINESEKKTVGEIKELVTNEDLTIQSIIEDYKPKNYSFEKSYISTAKKTFNFILKEINFTKSDLKLNFWLSQKEILSEKIGDDEDLAVFLCSILYSLGDEKAEVVIAELDNLTTHAFVITEFKNQFILLDPSQKKPFEEFIGEKKEAIKKYSFNGAKIKRFLYKFNHNNYEQFI